MTEESTSWKVVLVGAGDIALCGTPGAEQTATLLDRIAGTVFAAGDNAYVNGSATEYRDCYHRTWGRHRGRTRPVPGNHDYQTPNATGYFDYFGASAGPVGLGYYSYTLGSWLVLAVNSEVTASVWGVASFTLQDDRYTWAFIPVEGEAFRDSGTGMCH